MLAGLTLAGRGEHAGGCREGPGRGAYTLRWGDTQPWQLPLHKPSEEPPSTLCFHGNPLEITPERLLFFSAADELRINATEGGRHSLALRTPWKCQGPAPRHLPTLTSGDDQGLGEDLAFTLASMGATRPFPWQLKDKEKTGNCI